MENSFAEKKNGNGSPIGEHVPARVDDRSIGADPDAGAGKPRKNAKAVFAMRSHRLV
jgi:hypothetical protein